jgi:uncharacterized protein involved in exopolysaccharide biosynthesis
MYDFWQDIYRRGWLVLTAVAAACALAYFLSGALPPIYQAKTVFFAPANALAPTYTDKEQVFRSLAQPPFLPPTEEKAASTGIGILRSRSISQEVLKRISGLTQEELQRSVDIKTGREFMLEVYVRNADPAKAAEIANLYPELFKTFQEEQISGRMREIGEAAASQVAEIDARLQELVAGGGGAEAGILAGRSETSLRQEAESLRLLAIEASLQAKQPSAPVVIVESASAPAKPIFPIMLLNIIVAGVTAFALGIYYALFCGFLERAREQRVAGNIEEEAFSDAEIDEAKAVLGAAS